MSEELRRLVGPYELLDLPDRGSVRFVPVSSEFGSMLIHPRSEGAPAEKEIPVLRVHIKAEFKAYPPYYWDITSKFVHAQLRPMLGESGFENYLYTITKYGVAPRARFTVEREALPA